MNSLFASLGALGWKPLLSALLLPPASLLIALLLGLWLRHRRPWLSGGLVSVSLVLLWFSHCRVSADWLETHALRPPAVLAPEDLPKLKRSLAGKRPVVLVLGGGIEAYAPEYGEPHLSDRSLQRLHYALWLARRLDAPVMFSGGVGHEQVGAAAEATIAARLAERDYGRNIRWVETRSTDTRGNAHASLPVLTAEGATEVLVVTDRWHMPRALRALQDTAALAGSRIRFTPAPMGASASSDLPLLNWMPSVEGYRRLRSVLREAIGLLAGA